MKAMVCTKYGAPEEVLKLEEVENPIPTDWDVLVRVRATSVTAADYRIRGLNVPRGFKLPVKLAMGFNKPRNPILGTNFAGEVEQLGRLATKYKVGDRVFGSRGEGFGAYAEMIALPESAVLRKMPENMSFEEGAALPFGALTAFSYLRDKAKIKKGDSVLIYGASGAVGTASIQIAKYYGADVTAVCSVANIDLVKSLGADSVLDYNKDDYVKSAGYDIIFDTVGKTSFEKALMSLKDGGRYLLAVADMFNQFRAIWTSMQGKKKVIAGIASERSEDLDLIVQLFEDKKLVPVIDKVYSFSDLPAAHAYAEQGHKKGNVVITM